MKKYYYVESLYEDDPESSCINLYNDEPTFSGNTIEDGGDSGYFLYECSMNFPTNAIVSIKFDIQYHVYYVDLEDRHNYKDSKFSGLEVREFKSDEEAISWFNEYANRRYNDFQANNN